MMKRKKITTPLTTYNGKQKILNIFSDKPPKLRFKPGQFFKYQGSIWEIMYCYRTKDEPNIWKVCLEESRNKSQVIQILEGLGCGDTTPRIMYDCFYDSMDAMSYFSDIPANGDRLHVRTKELINNGILLTSGEITKIRKLRGMV